MKGKKKYCLNMSSYKFKCGFKHLLPPIILKESNNLNINIENIIAIHNKCPCGKNCPNFKVIIELKQEIIKLIDKITQLKKINEYSIPSIPHPKSNITPERENEKNYNNIYNQLINSFRNSSKKNRLIEIKNNSNKTDIFKNNIFNSGKIKLRPSSAKASDLKESFEKLFNKDKIKTEEKKEKDNDLSNFQKKINLNFFSSSCRKRNKNSLNNKTINKNQRYEENNNNENKSNSRKLQFFNHESFSSLRKSKVNELSSLNLHLSNSIISPAIKITPKNLFEPLKAYKENKGNNTFENKDKNNF